MPDAPILADILRRRGYFKLLVYLRARGHPVSVVAFGFLALEHELTDVFWEDLPDAVGFDEAPWWWGSPSLIVAGVIVAFAALGCRAAAVTSPRPASSAGPTQPAHLRGSCSPASRACALGAVIGPEAILLALGSGAALLFVWPLLRNADPSATALVGVSGAFAAIATILGSPLIAAVFMIEAIGFDGAQLFATMLPGLLCAGIGALMFTGLGEWTGLRDPDARPPAAARLPAPELRRRPVVVPDRRRLRAVRLRDPAHIAPRSAGRPLAADAARPGRRRGRRRSGRRVRADHRAPTRRGAVLGAADDRHADRGARAASARGTCSC